MTPPHRRAPRSDARDNRARIIAAARAALADDPDTPLQAIAKAVGVGQGTMYRHFPSRESLLLAVYREDVEALVDSAPRLLEDHEPLEALRRWLDQLAAYGRVKHAASRAVEAATRADLSHEYYAPVVGALGRLLDAGKEAHRIRPDADPEDVLLLVSFLWRPDGGPAGHERSRRLLTVVTDGLRAGAHA
ncbi:TetR/AcrR family transcriptional regulator [Streptomyces boncukensis]|uniref:TetR/AcrR family transcriptional regulator n=1 Tax=Streptomyces boncukensis TaxID=2711219 RepID=A0A6G4X008_9ACTN|nr:TetR/AcrR family transcriptional regulator [Streptomyces boncukensis]NGO70876.1 TetR/AcrR family transcriptional regulator [Streptomyces boncukensis]